MKKPVCPFNYMEANLGLSQLIDKSENLLYTIERDKDVSEKNGGLTRERNWRRC